MAIPNFCENTEKCEHGCHAHFHHWPPFWGYWFRQHTEPLLFDECITIEEKISVLNFKLQWLLDNFQKFVSDFCVWAKEVESALEDLQEQITALKKQHEEDVKRLQGEIDDLEGRVTKNENDIASLNERMSEAETDITELKRRVSTNEQAILELQTKLQELNTKFTELEVKVNQNITDITELKRRVTTTEENITNIKNDITNINKNITNITNNLTQYDEDLSELQTRVGSVETRLSQLEETISNLKIDLPVEIISEEDMYSKIAPAWLKWVKTLCMDSFGDDWEVTKRLSPNDGTDVAGGFMIGRVIANVAQCKLPLIARCQLEIQDNPQYSDIQTIMKALNKFAHDRGLYALRDSLNAENGFFDVELTNAYPKQLDEYKLTCSYIPFAVQSAQMGGNPFFFKLSDESDVTSGGEIHREYMAITNTFNVNVRLQFTAGEKKAKLCVATPEIYLSWIDGWVYLYMVAELG